jgi:hypothetical protein
MIAGLPTYFTSELQVPFVRKFKAPMTNADGFAAEGDTLLLVGVGTK